MGRNSKNKRREQAQRAAASPAATTPGPAPTSGAPSSSIGTVSIGQLEQQAQAQGIEVTTTVTTPDESEAELRRRLQALVEGYTRAQAKLEERELAVLAAEEERKAVDQRASEEKERLDAERQHLQTEGNRIRAAEQALEPRRRELAELEERLLAREADADAGFVRRRSEILGSVEAALAEVQRRNQEAFDARLRQDEEHQQRLEAHRQQFVEGLEARRKAFESELDARRAALEEEHRRCDEALAAREGQVEQRDAELTARLRRAGWTERDLREREEQLEAHIENVVQERAAEVARERDAARARETELSQRLTALELERAKEREALALLGGRGPEAIRDQILKLQAQVADLTNQLADRPSADLQSEVARLQAAQQAWDTERRALRARVDELETQLGRRQTYVYEVETLRDQVRVLDTGKKALTEALKQLGKDVDERLTQRGNQPAFPELTKLDQDSALNERQPSETTRDNVSFAQLAAEIRQRLATRETPLHYREQDLRAFLGGLAMSRLHLLQGISGIGKSSLPRAFAEAVGGECRTVSVQAGWRDRNDLFGHYNTFERRYHETSFVQALYRAGRPALEDRIVFVLLDEMNLSHPEQYAADLLDVLERPAGDDRRFELVSFEPPGTPPRGLKAGRFLPLPDNVWFVGTANHDETTKDFADKTYDRSFVLELPSTLPAAFKASPPKTSRPLSRRALCNAFDAAAAKHAKTTAEAGRWLRDVLGKPLSERLRIGLAGRLGKQVGCYLPVVIEAGGSLGEALDQVVTTRLLRKLVGRHDTLVEDVQHLQQVIGKEWPCKATPPASSIELLARELKRLQG